MSATPGYAVTQVIAKMGIDFRRFVNFLSLNPPKRMELVMPGVDDCYSPVGR